MISIVLPTYNREEDLQKCLFSILRQTYTDFELIVVDDCSDNNVAALIKKINDNRIKYIRMHSRSGAYQARNAGLRVMGGDYFLTWDNDDFMYPTALSELMSAISQDPLIDMVWATANFIKNKKILEIPKRESGYISYYDFLKNQHPMNDAFILIKKNIISDKDIFLGPNIDYVFYLRLLAKAKKTYHLNKILGEVFLESDVYSETIVRRLPDYKKSIARVRGLEILLEELGGDLEKIVPKRLADIAYGLSLGEILSNKKKAAIKYAFKAIRYKLKYLPLLFILALPFSGIFLKLSFQFRRFLSEK
jgi:glycosyltransferase involved in cell wall biosynthesis